MKKRTIALLAALVCLALSGCCMQHEWKDATCTAPKTCTKCEKVEGEALGHIWKAATCTEAELCTVCGEKNSEPLGHTANAATCTEAEICTVCGETLAEALGHKPEGANFQTCGVCVTCGEAVGDPLTPAFVEKGVKGTFVELGKEYDFVTRLYATNYKKTTGKLKVTDYKVTAASEEGFEWRTVTVKVTFTDKNVKSYGIAIDCGAEDYYDIVKHDASYTYEDSNKDGAFTVNWNGQDYTECQRKHKITTKTGSNPLVTFTVKYEFLVPVGYDGMVVSFLDYAYAAQRGPGVYIYDLADENTLHFRLN